MCLLIVKYPGEDVDLDILFQAAYGNDDGFGFAYHRKGRVKIYRSLKYEDFEDEYERVVRKSDPAILHLRFGTSGEMDLANCHPFKLDKHKVVFGHNGILDCVEPTKALCDTAMFGKLLESLPKRFWLSEKWMKFIGSAVYPSKLAFLDTKGKIRIVNKDKGFIHEGCWYSNLQYKPKEVRSYIPMGTLPAYKPTYKAYGKAYGKETVYPALSPEPVFADPWSEAVHRHYDGDPSYDLFEAMEDGALAQTEGES
jgi:hypothetical protein